MRKRFSPAFFVLALGACTVHDAADPVADVDRTDLAGSYLFTEFLPEWQECLFAWLDMTAGGSFVLSYGYAVNVTAASGCAAAEANADEYGGWEGSYANLGTYIAFEASSAYRVYDDGTRDDFEYRTDLTGRYDPSTTRITVMFADPWGFGDGSEGGAKAGGKEEGNPLSELLFLPD